MTSGGVDKTVGTSPARRIGIMARLLGAANLAPMVEAAVETAESRGFSAVVISSGTLAEEEAHAWHVLQTSGCEGFLVSIDCHANSQLTRSLSARDDVIQVDLNDELVGEASAIHLLDKGHRQIAMVTGPSDSRRSQRCSEAFARRLDTSNYADIRLRTLEADMTVNGGADAMKLLLASGPQPTAVFFQTDQMALGAFPICQKNRLRIPDDISLLGCSSSGAGSQAHPTLCTIDQSLRDAGEKATGKLLDRLNGTTSGVQHCPVITPTLVSRHSVRDMNSTDDDAPDTVITERERECLQWAAIGKTSWEISQIVGVTESTIIYHLRNATRKLDAANRLHAVAKALKASIIDI